MYLYIGNLMVQAIPMIGNWLVCKVTNGEQVRVGIGMWIGSIDAYKMLKRLLEVIQDRVIYTLNQIVDENSTNIWKQGWIKANLGLERDLAEAWNTHVDNLTRNHVRIWEEGDSIASSRNLNLGVCIVKLWYRAIFHSGVDQPK
jgi:hypothetical protein